MATAESTAPQDSVPSFTSLAAIVSGAMILQLANSALHIIVPLQLALAGRPATLIGLVASGYAAGFLLGCFIAPVLARRVGHIRAFAIVAALQAILSLSFVLIGSPESWVVLRFIMGAAGAGIAIITESWINDRTPQSHRGRIFGLYNVLNRLALITGQIVPTLAAIPAATAYVLASALFSLSLVPVSMTVTRSPTPPQIVTLRVRQLWSGSPISVIGCLYVGLVASALVNIVPVFGVAVHLDEGAVGMLTASVQVGSLVLQWPLGYLSDRMDRRRVMLAAGAVSAVASMALAFAGWTGALRLTLAFALIGGTSLPIYALSVAHAFDKLGRDSAVALSSSLLFTWAAGSIAGPILVTGMMQALGAPGFVFYIAGLSAGFVVFTIWRLARQTAPGRQATFVPVPQTPPIIGKIDPRRERPPS
jgi:MFS family permease